VLADALISQSFSVLLNEPRLSMSTLVSVTFLTMKPVLCVCLEDEVENITHRQATSDE